MLPEAVERPLIASASRAINSPGLHRGANQPSLQLRVGETAWDSMETAFSDRGLRPVAVANALSTASA
jgi:hypothetical protein